ncbi:MAG: ribonuclease III [Candidatus Ryanbacteria bacterium RIFCSPHIGHO2_12_FULL_47_12b]|uniref:Ribonuclease 3 n=3 Tax=Parcubacteria group TaxID=1794811 RepID=A0A1G2H2K0_9BACT|nr:MAG: Ribonuclease 3 [Parcubacteria group bacterium GW2011_GWA2_47_10b]KKU75724.1 MAG: Ribonuclease 3 [Candidatus Giovannonibacteria bacterium GW2011_GWB1_47_6b]KKU86258.1 MAG: Ribonuclease 3 [Parcubacteria group bacterium GW2011_GWA1_47_9]OGZ53002.1 MAG: ribonuclease III [Candidatus Ryanbacteria bacterium RIFCSPHIGHO2_12_FULL_47_12b]OGZ56422.1 MAG: ribonuclease III [Candidatus Ryanbacteria bacterium RIFCSPLOWO2_02_FULL_47_14]OGZ56706.1 MAG: ribonuclease III [Candidatus Ryanbacteria bacteriu
MIDIVSLEKRTGVRFKNKKLLTQALTHRSYINENPSFALGHNERLEFLGDAVLELVITEALFNQYPEKPEGELTSLRAALVNAEMLAAIASGLGLNNYLLLSRGEKKDTGRARSYILANTFEAFVGALYIDQGHEVCSRFIIDHVFSHLNEVIEKKLWRDPKSAFQEDAQEQLGITPNYRVLREAGPDHAKQFSVGVYVGDELVAQGSGPSKQDAEIEAARKALEKKGWA